MTSKALLIRILKAIDLFVDRKPEAMITDCSFPCTYISLHGVSPNTGKCYIILLLLERTNSKCLAYTNKWLKCKANTTPITFTVKYHNMHTFLFKH